MSGELLRRAAAFMRGFGPIHEAIAEGLVNDATRLDAGTISPADAAESIDLATMYLGRDS